MWTLRRQWRGSAWRTTDERAPDRRAAHHGHAGTARALLTRGADVDRANDRGQTPLAGAVFKGEDEVIRALVAAGADPDAGQPSARAAAAVFGQLHLVARFDRG